MATLMLWLDNKEHCRAKILDDNINQGERDAALCFINGLTLREATRKQYEWERHENIKDISTQCWCIEYHKCGKRN